MQSLTKLDAARALLDGAMTMILDRQEYVSGIVLAGAAEDVLQGLLKRAGKDQLAARAQMNSLIRAMHRSMYPSDPPMKDSTGHNMMRSTYNWLRHNDDPLEPQSIDVDLVDEAIMVAERAVENLHHLGTDHPRVGELVALHRSRP